jgi:thiol-disulfide isomerase/thioredoxin
MRPSTVVIALSLALASLGAEEPPHKLPIGATRPSLSMHLINGAAGPTWTELRGSVVVIDFWAAWCTPCVESIPHMNAIEAELKNDPVKFYAVTYEPRAKAKAFLAAHPMNASVAIDDDLSTFSSFAAWGIPMVYVLDGNGRVAAVVHPNKLTANVIRTVLAGKIPDVEAHPGWKDPIGAAKYFREQLEIDRARYGRE